MGYGVGFRRAVNANTLYPQSLIRAWLFPAEDTAARGGSRSGRPASMRPRVFPAEDWPPSNVFGRISDRFNEAAGIPRGRLVRYTCYVTREFVASMRPRVFPAEDDVTGRELTLERMLQ